MTLLINEFGCDVKDTGYKGRPVLHRACESGSTSLVRTLINDYSADCNVRDNQNNLPIHIAAFCGREEVVTLLINEFGCDVKDTGYKGRPVLHQACESGNTSLVRTLIREYKADFNSRDCDSNRPIHLAAANGRKEVVLLLINEFKCDVTVRGYKNQSLLHEACGSGNVNLVQTLIHDFRGDLSARDENNDTPISIAALREKKEVISALLTDYNCSLKSEADNRFSSLTDYQTLSGIAFSSGITHETVSCGLSVELESDIGLSISAPNEVIPPSELAYVTTAVAFSGPFQMPEGIEPTSPVYLIKFIGTDSSSVFSVKLLLTTSVRSSDDLVLCQASCTPSWKPKPVQFKVEDQDIEFCEENTKVVKVNLQSCSSWLRLGMKATTECKFKDVVSVIVIYIVHNSNYKVVFSKAVQKTCR